MVFWASRRHTSRCTFTRCWHGHQGWKIFTRTIQSMQWRIAYYEEILTVKPRHGGHSGHQNHGNTSAWRDWNEYIEFLGMVYCNVPYRILLISPHSAGGISENPTIAMAQMMCKGCPVSCMLSGVSHSAILSLCWSDPGVWTTIIRYCGTLGIGRGHIQKRIKYVHDANSALTIRLAYLPYNHTQWLVINTALLITLLNLTDVV